MGKILIPRRNFLKGLGGVSLALPMFSSLACSSDEQRRAEKIARARQALGFPKRFVFVYTPNGNYEPPTEDFSGQWSVLSPIRPKLSVVTGLDLAAQDLPPGEPHQQGMALLTGRGLNPGDMVGGDGSHAGWASGISLDQELAKEIGGMTIRPTFNLGVQSTMYGGTEVRTVLSYLGSDTPVANETSPYNVYNDVFSQLTADPAGAEKLRARRKSVIDVVGRQYVDLSKKLSKDDKAKLEQHLTSVRDVEMRLDNPGGVLGGACQMPGIGSPIDLNDPANFGIVGQLHMDLLVMALACDLTRVCTLQWSAATNNRPYPFLTYEGQPIQGDDHALGHMSDTDTVAWAKLFIIRRWYLEQFLYLIQKLDAIPEGEGTMLDNTVVVLGSEITRGNTHSHLDAPFLIAGSAGGYLKTGQFLRYDGTKPHNNLLVTVLNAMGVEATTFGDPAYCTGDLPELVV
jgi:Protein of unknown function (DUF1552)